MIDNLKHNTKIKLISLLSAVFLWMYVMAVVDPEETIIYENMPVTISNINELQDNNLMIYPEMNLTTDIYITGKLSSLQKVDKDDIHIYGTFKDIEEGTNELILRATIAENVSHDFKENRLEVPIEKYVTEQKRVNIKVEDSYIKDIDEVIPEVDSVLVSGPRSKVDEVYELRAMLAKGDNVQDYNEVLKLIPIDDEGKEVHDVELDRIYIDTYVSLLKSKEVEVNLKFKNLPEDIDLDKDVIISDKKIFIRGKKSLIDTIKSVDTVEIDFNKLSNKDTEYMLSLPEGVYSDKDSVKVKLKEIKTIKDIFTFKLDEIDIINNNEELDLKNNENVEFDEVNVEVEYNEDENITKDDISLYIDIEKDSEDDKYNIKYKSDKEIISINITPKEINKQ